MWQGFIFYHLYSYVKYLNLHRNLCSRTFHHFELYNVKDNFKAFVMENFDTPQTFVQTLASGEHLHKYCFDSILWPKRLISSG